MRINHKGLALVVAAGALTIAVPATAHPGSGSAGHGKAATHTHRCGAHKVAYIVSGTITDGSAMTKNSDGTWSGSLSYTVRHHNHWAKNDSGSATLSNVKVRFKGATTDFSSGNRVRLVGKLQYVRTKGHSLCSNPGPQGAPTFRRAVVSPPAS